MKEEYKKAIIQLILSIENEEILRKIYTYILVKKR